MARNPFPKPPRRRVRARTKRPSRAQKSQILSVIRAHENKVVERKQDTTLATYGSGAGGLIDAVGGGLRTNLTLPLQGDDDIEFVGRKVTQKRLMFNYELKANATAVVNPVRIMLVRMHNGAAPALGSILETVSSNSYAMITNYRRDPTANYTILYDRVHAPVYNAAGMWQRHKVSLDLKEHSQTWFESGAGDAQGSIFMVAFGDQTTNRVGFAYKAVFDYTDQ